MKTLLDENRLVGEKGRIGIFFENENNVSAVLSLCKPHRIKASHRRRWKGTTGHSVYIMNNPLSGTDPTGYAASAADCDKAQTCTPSETKQEPKKQCPRESASQKRFNMACGGYCQGSAKSGGNGVGGQAPKQASRERETQARTSEVPVYRKPDQWREPERPAGVDGVIYDSKKFFVNQWDNLDIEKELSPLQMIVPAEGVILPVILRAGKQEALAAKVLTEAGELRLSSTAANSIANRAYVTPLTAQEAIAGGIRVPDPQGVAGRFMYTVDVMTQNGKALYRNGEVIYKKSAAKFEVLVNEVDDIIEHAVIKRSK